MRALIVTAVLIALPSAATAAGLIVPIDQSRVLPISGIVSAVVVGNTDIADVRLIDSRTVVVIGKRAGVTNVMVRDPAGRMLFNEQVSVAANAGSAVTIFRGVVSQELACSPYCQAVAGAGAPAAAASAAPPAAQP